MICADWSGEDLVEIDDREEFVSAQATFRGGPTFLHPTN